MTKKIDKTKQNLPLNVIFGAPASETTPFITDFDRYLLGEGTHLKSYEKLGAHAATQNGMAGVYFAVWAPNAKTISVVGDFNGWTAGTHPLAKLPESEFWAGFLTGIKEGDIYKYAITSTVDGQVRLKSDPYAFFCETRPKTASIVTSTKNMIGKIRSG